jgi:hypothetical protein
MNDPFYTVALYLFSALLQADAAILGLGIVFIIFRLQHIYNVYQPYVTRLLSSDDQSVPLDCNKITKGVTTQEADEILARYKVHKDRHLFPAFEFIIEYQPRINNIKRTFIPPMITVAAHCLLSSISLWYMSFLPTICSEAFVHWWGGLVVLGFSFSLLEVITGAQVAFEVKPLIKGFPLSSHFIKQSVLTTQTGSG